MRTILLALAVAAVLWWLFRPQRRGRRAEQSAEAEPTYRAVKTFRTSGGFGVTIWTVRLRSERWLAWTCDCGVHNEGHDSLRDAASDAVAHIERRHAR